LNNIKSYYAAANGYSGFRSYFEKIFTPEKFESLFILKGGPGTGKSTLMKRLLSAFFEMGYACDAIYCSSDPRSLDGIIVAGRVAVIDGTAPHEKDAHLPGACDEIINLGECWRADLLKEKRDKIEKINEIKKNNYNSAYKYLAISGKINDYIKELLIKSFDFSKCESCVENTIQCFSENKNKSSVFLISAFGKDGFSRRDFSGFDVEKLYSVNGNFGEEELFFDVMYKAAEEKYSPIRIPSPFEDKTIEGLYFENDKTLFIANGDNGDKINASAFLDKDFSHELEFLKKSKEEFLEKSKEAFGKASEAHFMLEEIYSSAMDFTKCDTIYENLYKNILKIFSHKSAIS